MFKGLGSILSTSKGEMSKTLSVPIEFSSPISREEWTLVQQAVYARLASSPVQVIIPGNFEKQFTVVFTGGYFR